MCVLEKRSARQRVVSRARVKSKHNSLQNARSKEHGARTQLLIARQEVNSLSRNGSF